MKSILKMLSSASRVIAITLTFAVVGLTFARVISPEQFMVLAVLAYKHFFDNSGKTVDNSVKPQGEVV